MTWLLFWEVCYLVILVAVCLRIIMDTRSTTKSLAYLLIAIFIPFAGMIFYFFFGINYRKNIMYSKKLLQNDNLAQRLKKHLYKYSELTYNENKSAIQSNKELAYLLLNDGGSPLTANNDVKILVNGENKFPEVLKVLKSAKNHIHIEYYIFEDDEIGRAIETILIEKAKEGVMVRFIYDDFGSSSIRKKLVPRLKANAVQAFPFLKVYFIAFANRLNYRNHRKIIVVDGSTAFVGGINVSDKYINHPGNKKLFWRDTHMRIDGPGVHYLQYLFFCDWNFCSKETILPDEFTFPRDNKLFTSENKIVQIAASGPDSERPTILFSIIQAINLATKEILITSPYFIPGESLSDALVIASLSGVSVKLLVPGISDSVLVNFAARSYYNELLKAGVEIYQYQKGFVHAKTFVSDNSIAMIGTANMDFRSFDLNFEVNAIVYDQEIANQLSGIFYEDIKYAEKLDAVAWNNRPRLKRLFEKTARLVSPLL
ncbi:MAG: cardiolipin synthase [Ginsengibacter sp.]